MGGGRGNDEDGAWVCLHSVEGVGDAVELGQGVPDEDLLNDPPEGRAVGDMIIHASMHA